MLEVGENLIIVSYVLLLGWIILYWQVLDEVKLLKILMLVYYLLIEFYIMVECLQVILVVEGCEFIIIFYNVKNWDDMILQVYVDFMMGDRLIGEVLEYILE